jgi:hypothetical protein
MKVTITDREIDLAIQNYGLLQQQNPLVYHSDSIQIAPLDWSDISAWKELKQKPKGNLAITLIKQSVVDIVIGAELACLLKQQAHLCNTFECLALENPNMIIFLTFDGVAKRIPESKYESAMLEKMKNVKFFAARVYTGCVEWWRRKDERVSNEHTKYATIRDVTLSYDNDLDVLSFPSISLSPVSATEGAVAREEYDLISEETSFHHIILFYRPTAINTCSRCHKQFFHSHPLFSSNRSCQYHEGFYVCRRHPAETKCSINGLGDNLGYYGNGVEGWDANFWDCCGSEDKNESGCGNGPHKAY